MEGVMVARRLERSVGRRWELQERLRLVPGAGAGTGTMDTVMGQMEGTSGMEVTVAREAIIPMEEGTTPMASTSLTLMYVLLFLPYIPSRSQVD
jgi:hypothetical protein